MMFMVIGGATTAGLIHGVIIIIQGKGSHTGSNHKAMTRNRKAAVTKLLLITAGTACQNMSLPS